MRTPVINPPYNFFLLHRMRPDFSRRLKISFYKKNSFPVYFFQIESVKITPYILIKYCTIQNKAPENQAIHQKKLYIPAFSLLESIPMLEVALPVPHRVFSGAAILKINPLMEASMAKAAKATLTKSELIDTLHSKNGTLTKKAVSEVVDQVFSTITDHVAKGTAVNIVGFGKFHAVKRAARTGRNPATGAVIKIAATTTPRFAAGKAFKDSVARKK